MRKRDRLFRQAQRRDNAQAWHRWRNQRNLVTSLNRKLKNEHLKQKISLLIENKKSPYKYHNILKSVTGFKKNDTIPPLIMGEDILSDDDQKAEAFNTYFSAQTNISISNYNIEFLRKYRSNHIKTPHTFRFTEITPDEVMRTGLTDISGRMPRERDMP